MEFRDLIAATDRECGRAAAKRGPFVRGRQVAALHDWSQVEATPAILRYGRWVRHKGRDVRLLVEHLGADEVTDDSSISAFTGAELALADTVILLMKVMSMHGIIDNAAIVTVFADLENRYRAQKLHRPPRWRIICAGMRPSRQRDAGPHRRAARRAVRGFGLNHGIVMSDKDQGT